MNQYFAYTRVSTARQGEGVSLSQQRDAIERYAQRNELRICRWFEEQETAAKQGRPVFGELVKRLRKGDAAGVLIHKIDRSARNLRDWSDLGELIDRGIEIHFANEALDLSSRGGRLSADIQAVVAADYIRNLREETIKGMYGRLKQGFYPMPAPLGYADNGAGRAKTPDPQKAPLVRTAFELYATGRYNLLRLGQELNRLGLRSKNSKPIGRTRLSELLNNPFYYGLIRIQKTGQYFTGVHQPLISKAIFDRVQAVLQGKINSRSRKHDFLFRRRLTCKQCERSLIGETHKGFIYYRCKSAHRPFACVREEVVEAAVLEQLYHLQLSSDERTFLEQALHEMRGNAAAQRHEMIQSASLQLSHVEARLRRLTDALIDRLIDQDLFEDRKKALLMERLDLQSRMAELEGGRRDPTEELANFLERANTAYSSYQTGTTEEKRVLIESAMANRVVDHKTPIITLSLPFQAVAARPKLQNGGPHRDTKRTWQPLLTKLLALITTGVPDVRRLAA
jgi:site-specific DNA recombinase